MVLNQLELENFKQFNEKTVKFKPGLNVIKGPNEIGKTTIRTALMVALFANPSTTSEAIKQHKKWQASTLFRLKLNYTDEQQRSCVLDKNFEEKKVILKCNGEHFKIPKAIHQKVIDDIGLANEDMYYLTSSLNIRSLDNLGNAANRKQLGKMISGLMSGAESGQDVLIAIKKISETLKELNKGIKGYAKTPGPIKKQQENHAQFLATFQEQKAALITKNKRIEERLKINGQLCELENTKKNVEQLIAVNQKLFDLKRRREELFIQEKEYEIKSLQRKELEQEFNTLNAQIKDEPLLIIPAGQINQLMDYREEKKHLEAFLQEEKNGKIAEDHLIIIVSWGICIAGMGLIFFQWLAGIFVALLGAIALLMSYHSRKEQKKALKNQEEKQRKILKKKDEIEHFVRQWEEQIKQPCDEKLRDRWQTVRSLKIKHETLKNQLDKNLPVDESRWGDVRRELRLIEDDLNSPEMATMQITPEKLINQQRQLEQLKKKRDEFYQRLTHVDALINSDTVNQEKLAATEEKIEESKRELVRLNQQQRTGQLALDYLERARRDTMNPARQVLEKRAGELLAEFTGGKYKNIAVDDEDMTSKILIRNTDKWEDPGVLSQGAFDQFYLSLRLAMSEILSGGKKTPLLLDEPLSAFDMKRFDAALRSLKLLSKERQVLIFSCRKDYDYMADNIIELTGGWQ